MPQDVTKIALTRNREAPKVYPDTVARKLENLLNVAWLGEIVGSEDEVNIIVQPCELANFLVENREVILIALKTLMTVRIAVGAEKEGMMGKPDFLRRLRRAVEV